MPRPSAPLPEPQLGSDPASDQHQRQEHLLRHRIHAVDGARSDPGGAAGPVAERRVGGSSGGERRRPDRRRARRSRTSSTTTSIRSSCRPSATGRRRLSGHADAGLGCRASNTATSIAPARVRSACPTAGAPPRARGRPTSSRRRSRSTTGRRTSMPRPSTWARPSGARAGARTCATAGRSIPERSQAARHREPVLRHLQYSRRHQPRRQYSASRARSRQQRQRHYLDDRGRPAVLEEPLRQHGPVQCDAAERSVRRYRDQRAGGASGHDPGRHSGRQPERQGRHVPVEQPLHRADSPRT